MEQKLSQILACIGLCLLLAACAGPEVPEFHTEGKTLAPKRATSRPYQIKGIWYYPQPYYEYEEEGVASFYGGGDVFHGRPTATGERFDMNGITGAHTILPLPCLAKVINLENGRELVVKINDRGPFIQGRLIDLSRRGAQLLGFENKGLARVRVITLVPESLALNGIDPSTTMIAQATPTPVVEAAPLPATSILATKDSDPDTLFEALGNSSPVNDVPPQLVPVRMAEDTSKESLKVAEDTPEEPPEEPLKVAEDAPEAPLKVAEDTPEEPLRIAEDQSFIPVVQKQPSPMPVKLEALISTGIFVHVGEYETYTKAQALLQSLDGFAESPIEVVKYKGPRPYVARLGPLPSMSYANQILDQLLNAGYLICRIVIQH